MADSANSKRQEIEKQRKRCENLMKNGRLNIFLSKMQTLVFDLQSNYNVNRVGLYNIKRHYDSKHADGVYGKLKGRNQELKVDLFKRAARTMLRLLLFGPLLKKFAHPCSRPMMYS